MWLGIQTLKRSCPQIPGSVCIAHLQVSGVIQAAPSLGVWLFSDKVKALASVLFTSNEKNVQPGMSSQSKRLCPCRQDGICDFREHPGRWGLLCSRHWG